MTSKKDNDLFQRAMGDVTPLKGRGGERKATSSSRTAHTRSFKPLVQPRPRVNDDPLPEADIGRHTPAPSLNNLDGNLQKRLIKGQLPIEGRLDLHGLRMGPAQDKLTRFLADAEAAGKRCVIVITGKGGKVRSDADDADFMAPRTGLLRDLVPQWLAQPVNASRVLAYTIAQPKDGGSGALYVMLKRRR